MYWLEMMWKTNSFYSSTVFLVTFEQVYTIPVVSQTNIDIR